MGIPSSSEAAASPDSLLFEAVDAIQFSFQFGVIRVFGQGSLAGLGVVDPREVPVTDEALELEASGRTHVDVPSGVAANYSVEEVLVFDFNLRETEVTNEDALACRC